jgi:hypothetical protein
MERHRADCAIGRRDEQPSDLSRLRLASRHTGAMRAAFDWCFRNRETGKITIAQFPNAALWIIMISAASRQAAVRGTTTYTVLEWLGTIGLAWWSLDELLRGVNPWRRFLGVLGLALLASNLISRFG